MEEIIQKVKSANSVAVLSHVNEDPDTLGSCFAFAAVLRNMGKKAVVYVSGSIEKRLEFIGGGYEEYSPKVSYDHDLCVCLDCGDLGRLGERKRLFDSIENTVSIDHHYSNTLFADMNYVEGDASSTGEILYMFFEKLGVEITPEIARYLYIAICSDTGCFKFSNVSSKTMHIAGNLLECGIDNADISRRLFECDSLNAVMLKAEVTQSIESYYDGKLKLVVMTEALRRKYQIREKDLPSAVDIPRMIEGTEVAVCLKEQIGGVRVNLRANGSSDVSVVASKFGGGGHKKAAGCTVIGASMDEIKEKVVKECEYII